MLRAVRRLAVRVELMTSNRSSSRALVGGVVALGLSLAACAGSSRGSSAPAPTPAPLPTPAPTPTPAPAVAAVTPPPAAPAPPLSIRLDATYQLPPATSVEALPAAPSAYVFVASAGSMRVGRTASYVDTRAVPDVEGVLAALAAPADADAVAAPPPPPPEVWQERGTSSGILGSATLQQGGAFASLTGGGDDAADGFGGLLGDDAGEMSGGFGFGRAGFGPGAGENPVDDAVPAFELRFDRAAPAATDHPVVLVIDRGVRIDRIAELIEAMPRPTAIVIAVDGGDPTGARALAFTVSAGALPPAPVPAAAPPRLTVRRDHPFAELVALVDGGAADGASSIGVAVTRPARGGARRAAPPQTRIGKPRVAGSLGHAIIRRYIMRNMAKISYCYEKELLARPALAGTVTVTFEIATTGKVSSASAEGFDAALGTCVAGFIRAIEFPRPTRGTVTVRYPFTFSPGDH